MSITLKIEPITRIEGHLGIYVTANTSTRKIEKAYTIAIMFRGFEIILKNRTPDTAIFVTSRSCGVCGAAHANASTLACDMALGVPPTPLGACLRNLAYAMTDYTYDHSVLLSLLEGPDYSEYVVGKLTPSVYELAKSIYCTYSKYHGYTTIADMMRGWNPIPKPGKTYLLTVYYQRLAKEAGSLIYGKYAHPQTLVPGGIIYPVNELKHLFTYYLPRLIMLTMWVKFILSQWRDMLDFFYKYVEVKQAGTTYAKYQGKTYDPPIMLSGGLFEDPFAPIFTDERSTFTYEEVYEGYNYAYSMRLFRPGLAIGSKIVYSEFADLQRNMVELLTSGYYQGAPQYMAKYVTTDPLGRPLADGIPELVPYHEWNKQTIPNPGPLPEIPEKWNGEPYSWCAEPRMVVNGRLAPFEAGPIAKVWVQALNSAKYSLAPGLEMISGGGRIRITLPSWNEAISFARDLIYEAYRVGILDTLVDIKSLVPSQLYGLPYSEVPDLYDSELTIDWWNEASTTLFRLYARAFSLAGAIFAAWWSLEKLVEVYREKPAWYNVPGRPWKFPSYPFFAVGVGWLEAPRGAVRHWIVVKDGKIANYQYHAPTSGNATPKTNLEKLAKLVGKFIEPIQGVEGAVVDDCLVGPYEASALHVYITEELPPYEWTGLDVVRSIRSFDPCIGCAVHLSILGIEHHVKKYLSPICWSF